LNLFHFKHLNGAHGEPIVTRSNRQLGGTVLIRGKWRSERVARRQMRSDPCATADYRSQGSRGFESATRLLLACEHGARLAGRYRIVRLLGQGATGVVYEAIDERRSGLRVAIKLLLERQPNALYRLKNEFRALAEAVHPNLVGLHGLGVDPLGWFIVMDLVDSGCDFLTYVRRGSDCSFDEQRLRSALAQLVRGISAIHAAGKLHRDLKPRNVLVTREGRVVIVDFGLVSDAVDGGIGCTLDGAFAGTPAYAAPEQALRQGIGPKADLYAVGAMLYEALTGKLPLEDTSTERLLERKVSERAAAASSLAAGVPGDLEALCSDLLERDPALRPDARQVLERLGGPRPESSEAPSSLPFIARDRELSVLHEALASTRHGEPKVVIIEGPSGIGKTALLNRFFELVARDAGTVLFKGRCHAHEQVPFKAFDVLVDGLGRHLIGLSELESASLMPRGIALLARIFPTLSRVSAVLRMPWSRGSDSDEALLRVRAFAALKELFARIADRHALVVGLDDLQWSDQDSAELLRELLRPPGAPACLFACVFRQDQAGAAGLADTLRRLPGVRAIELALLPLEADSSSELARSLLGDVWSEQDVEVLVTEAAGSPFLIKELSRDARARGSIAGLSDAVSTRIAQIDAGARALLELVSIAGQPLEVGVAIRAAQAGAQALPTLLASSLLRTTIRNEREYLESQHDRIREAVVAGIDRVQAQQVHQRLAEELAKGHEPDPELIARHYRAAGLPRLAAPHVLAAAEHAKRALAFGRAAELYELAIAEAEEPARFELESALADSYANIGRLTEAAELFERGRDRTANTEVCRELAGKAMVLYLLVGNIERGARLLDESCKELGIRPLPQRDWLATLMIWLLLLRYMLGRRVSRLPIPTEHRHTQTSRQRIELCVRASRGIAHWSTNHASYFFLQGTLLIRRHRDPKTWPMAMVTEIAMRCVWRGDWTPRDEQDVARAIALAEAQRDEEVLALVLAAEGCRCVFVGRFAEGAELLERVEQVLTARGRSVAPVFNGTRTGRATAWLWTGLLYLVTAHWQDWLSEARALGDQFGELTAHMFGSQSYLALDDWAAARASAAALDSPLGRQSPFRAEVGWLGELSLHQGDPEGALAACDEAERSRFFRQLCYFACSRTWHALFSARASLAASAASPAKRAARLRRAAREARRLERERFAPAAACAAQIRAGIAIQRGDQERALSELESAAEAYTRTGVLLYAAAVRDRMARLLQGERGATLLAEARATALGLGVRNPEHYFRVLVPGFPD
jgi:eukaryotic-like serine/threonine-protein kinase